MSKRILLIDDEDDIREIAATSLEMIAGWQVISARSGEEGVLKAQQERPEAILLDVMMPEQDGASTLVKLRAEQSTAGIPVIFLTAKIQPAEQRRLQSLGAMGIVSKPFDPLLLPEKIKEILRW
jgi:DNA-binding response OmpR family regulator